MGKKDKYINIDKYIHNKNFPILTIDNRWHELFPEEFKTAIIKELELNINNLLKQQGKLVNDIKDMKKLKSNLMKEIVVHMDVSNDIVGKAKEKRLDRNSQFIRELNEKIERAMNELSEIPYLIKLENEALMVESFQIFYHSMLNNKNEITEITVGISKIRDELNRRILLKQDLEEKNTLIYSYMHDLLGANMMENIDNEYKRKSKD